MSTITFRGTTIWAAASNGVGWKFRPGTLSREVVEAVAPLGDGVWLKPAGWRPGECSLELNWRTATPGALRTTLQGLQGLPLGDLVVPAWGTYPRCMLREVGALEGFKSDGGLFIVTGTLVFRQFP